MKKYFLFALVALVCVSAYVISEDSEEVQATSDTSGSCGNDLTYTFDIRTGVLTISGSGAMQDYKDWYYTPWDTYREYIRTVIIGDSVTSIGDHAFDGCKSLSSVTLGDSVKTIGVFSFYKCASIISITLPASVTTVKSYAFANCYHLYEVVNLCGIDVSANDSRLSYASSVIGSASDTTVKTDENGFVYAKNIHGYYLICYLGTEKNITLPDKLDGSDYNIRSNAFNGNTYITSVIIPDSVTTIGYNAFNGCTSLKSVTIGSSVKSIDSVFPGCTSLVSIEVSENSQSFSSENGVLFSKDKTILYQYPAAKVDATYTIPDSVTTIGLNSLLGSGFCGCTLLASVTIPSSVTTIYSDAFSGCYHLSEVINLSTMTDIADRHYGLRDVDSFLTSASDSTVKTDSNGFVYSKGGDAYYLIGYNGNETDITLPANIEGSDYVIRAKAFYECSTLRSVTFSDSVTAIGDYAFYECRSLRSVNLGNSVASIGQEAFSHCVSLTSVTVPSSVTSIGTNAFDYCYGLFEVINLSQLEIKDGTYGFDRVKNYFTSASDATVKTDENGFVYGKNKNTYYLIGYIGTETDIVLPDNIEGSKYDVRDRSFYSRSDITSITVPDSVISIGYYVFSMGFYSTDGSTSLTLYIKNLTGYSFIKMADRFVREKSVIDFNTDGGSKVEKIDEMSGTQLTVPQDPVKTGYTFLYWTEDGSTEYVFPETMPAMDVHLTAVWQINQYTVTFDIDGTGTSQKYDYGTPAEDISVPSNPVKTGNVQYSYIFTGWDKEISEVTEDVTYAAVFEKALNGYTVTFRVDGAEVSVTEYDYGTAAENIVVPADPVKTSEADITYIFTEWKGYADVTVVTGDLTFDALFAICSGSGYAITSDTNAVTVSSAVLDDMRHSSNGILNVSLNGGAVTFDGSALKNVSAAELSISKLGYDEKASMKDIVGDSPVYRISFGSNTDFGDGKVIVTVPYDLKFEDHSYNLKVWHIDGTSHTEMPCSYADGHVTFETDHFSDFTVMYIEPEVNSLAIVIAMEIVVLIAAVACVFSVKKKKA